MPDKKYVSQIKDFPLINKLYKNKNTYNDAENLTYERYEEMRQRMIDVLNKYKDKYNEIIIVAHQRIISTIIDKELDFCEIYTFNYK